MPKNIKGGSKAKKGKNSALREFTRRLELPDDSGYQFYGLVLKHHGATTDIMFFDTRKNKDADSSGKLSKAVGYVRGSIKKRCRPKINDIVIIAVREYQDKKVDIIHKYNDDEMKELKNNNYFDEAFLSLIKANDAGVEVEGNDTNEIPLVDEDFIMFDENMEGSEDELDYI